MTVTYEGEKTRTSPCEIKNNHLDNQTNNKFNKSTKETHTQKQEQEQEQE
jgi:hypothetical protein